MNNKSSILSSPTRPPMMPVDFEAIPPSLRALRRWVEWSWSRRRDDDGVHWTKILRWLDVSSEADVAGAEHAVSKLRNAESDNPATWTTFDEAHRIVVQANGSLGLGFVFHSPDQLTGIDIDDCRNPTTGEITPEAAAIVAQLKTYTEVSPSGTGLKLTLRGVKPGPRCRLHKGNVELYGTGRYFTFTGHRLPDTPAEVMDRQAELNDLYAEMFPPEPERSAVHGGPSSSDVRLPRSNLALRSDDELIRRAMNATNGAKFTALWHGDTSSQHNDRSAADYALAAALAFWCGPDAARVESLMWQSGLTRKKWDRADYLPKTIARAIRQQKSYFGDGHWHDPELDEIVGVNVEIIRPRRRGPMPGPTPAYVEAAAGSDGAAATTSGVEFWVNAIPDGPPCPDEPRPSFPADDPVPLCPRCDRTILSRHRDGMTIILHTRCNAWTCHDACARALKRRWQDNVKTRLAPLCQANAMMYIAVVPKVAWRTTLKQINRAEGEYFRFSADDGDTITVMSTAAITGATEETAASVAERLTEALGRYAGDTPPIHSSKGWKLPVTRRGDGQPQHTRVGKVAKDVDDADLAEFFARNDCPTSDEPFRHDGKTQRKIGVQTPPWWWKDKLRWFYDRLKQGDLESVYLDPAMFSRPRQWVNGVRGGGLKIDLSDVDFDEQSERVSVAPSWIS